MKHANDRSDSAVIVVYPRHASVEADGNSEIALPPTKVFDHGDCVGDTGVHVDVGSVYRRRR